MLTLIALTLLCQGQPTPSVRPSLLDRVVVLGASASNGFQLGDELKSEATLGDFLSCALAGPGQDGEAREVATYASSYFFSKPMGIGRGLVAEATGRKPTLVVAMDFLFWFGYGVVLDENTRLAYLEQGLAMLEAFDVPLLVGDFPDMRGALHGESPMGPMISARQIPEPETLVRLNERLGAWASERTNVVVLPLAQHVHRILAGETILLRGAEWNVEAVPLLQPDLLHPSVDGTILLSLFILDALSRSVADFPEEAILWDGGEVRSRLLERTSKAREKDRERERKREERRRKSAERRAKKEAEKGAEKAGGAGDGTDSDGAGRGTGNPFPVFLETRRSRNSRTLSYVY